MKRILSTAALFLCCTLYFYAEPSNTDGGSVFYNMYLSAKKDGDSSKAMEYAAIFLNSADSASVTPDMAPVAEELSEYYEDGFNFSEALHWRKFAMKLYEGTDVYGAEAAENEYRLAKLYFRTGEYHRAYEHVSRVMDMFPEDSRDKTRLQCLNLLGALYYVCRDFDNSNYYFGKFAEGAEQINDTTLLVLALNNIAVYTNTVSDSLKTRSLISRCIDLCKNLEDNSLLCKMYINISASYINAGNMDEAREYLELARPLLGDIEEFGQYYHYMGVLDCLTGNMDRAVDNLNKAISYYDQGEFAGREQFCLELLQELYAMDGDYEAAYDALYRYYAISKEDRSTDAVIELFRTRVELMDRTKQEEAMALEKRRTVTLAVGIAFVVVAAVVVYLLFKRREYDIRRREQELAASKEMAEFKRTQQYKTDKLVEETIRGLNRLGAETEDPQMKSELSRMCNVLRNTKEQDEWKEMKEFVPQFNSDFYKNLIASYPSLTVNERRLCVFLNMNLTTKEISDITRQSVQTINTARGRLRKKLGITGDNVSIQEFLSKFN